MKRLSLAYAILIWSIIPGYYLILSLAIQFDIITRLVTLPSRIIPLVILTVAYIVSFRSKRVGYSRINFQLFILFSILYVGRILYDGAVKDNLIEQTLESYLSYFILSMFLPALFFMRINISLINIRLEKIFFYGMMILTLYFTISYYDKLGTARIKGTEDGALSILSIGYVSALMIALSINTFFNKKRVSQVRPVIALLAIAFSIIPLILSASRGPVLAIALSIFIILIRSKTKWKNMKVSMLFLLVVLLSGYFQDAVEKSGSALISRITNISADIDNDESSAFRLHLWREAIDLYKESPILGSQLELESGGYPHNIILEAFMTTGTIGGGIFLYLILLASYRAFKSTNDPNLSWLSVLFFISLGLYSVSGAIWGANWIIVPMAIFIGMKKSYKPTL